MKKMILVVAALASACGATDVYQQPLPSADDRDALMEIRDGLKPEDREAWQEILMRLVNPMASKIDAKTVGEAVSRVKERRACMDKSSKAQEALGDGPSDFMAPDYEKRNSAHIDAYNKTVEAYNACLKLPI